MGEVVAARPKVRVVVVNFDGDAVTRRCVDALLATEYPSESIEVVVVDNASVDGLNWVLKEHYPQVRLIESNTNEGFARGCNLAMRDLDGVDYVALINNDAIVEPNWLEPLLAGFVHPKVGAVCPKLLLNIHAHTLLVQPERSTTFVDERNVGVLLSDVLVDGQDRREQLRYDERFWGLEPARPPYPAGNWTKGIAKQSSVWWPVDADAAPSAVSCTLTTTAPMSVAVGGPDGIEPVQVDTHGVDVTRITGAPVRIINSAGGGMYKGWFGGDRGFMEPDIGQYEQPAEVFSWCGGAVLLSADYLRDVGIFDDSYFLYYEDFDLSWRGRAVGWVYRYEPASVVYHEHAYSSKAGSSFFTFWVDRNRRLTLVKNAPAGVAARACLGALRNYVLHIFLHTFSRLRHFRPPSPQTIKEQTKQFSSFMSAVPGALNSRRSINSRRTVSHRAIAAWTVTK
ncbi:MAG: glycosyltransferase [Actinomycetota bacterium]